jgi:pyruvate/2-oxoacid:ferredoxin oxidoreductase alpha subunit/NAD-dependent dihydropyrimidine dehydrogenase PreA subunit
VARFAQPQVRCRRCALPVPAGVAECGRCIGACALHCIEAGHSIDPATGLVPIELHLEHCTGCGLCIDACPEPYGLTARPLGLVESEPVPPPWLLGPPRPPAEAVSALSDEIVALPIGEPPVVVVKGMYAAALGALFAGCRHFFGYPITPSTEGAELMARLLPRLRGFFLQAVSEVATVNHMYGCGGAGKRPLTCTSSPGFSLMLEGISYLVGAELPTVVFNVMRGGPGLGNIGPEQSDIKLVCRGLGHGNTHAIVLAPASPQEMLDLTQLAFELAFKYRNPVVLAADGYLGQMTGRVELPPPRDGQPDAGLGRARGPGSPPEPHLLDLPRRCRSRGAQRAPQPEVRPDGGQRAKGRPLPVRGRGGPGGGLQHPGPDGQGGGGDAAGGRRQGRPLPAPHPVALPVALALLRRAERIVMVEASHGQLEDELRLAVSRAGLPLPRLESVQHYGGVLPQQREIVERVRAAAPAAVPAPARQGVVA